MTITLRTTKGSELTFAELDGNFTDLDGRILDSATIQAIIDSAYIQARDSDFIADSDVFLTKLGAVKGNIIPAVDSAYDLGDSTHRWKDLWLSGTTLHLGDATIGWDGNYLDFGQPLKAEMELTGDLDMKGNTFTTTTGKLQIAANLTGGFTSSGDRIEFLRAEGDAGILPMMTLGTSELYSGAQVTIGDSPNASYLFGDTAYLTLGRMSGVPDSSRSFIGSMIYNTANGGSFSLKDSTGWFSLTRNAALTDSAAVLGLIDSAYVTGIASSEYVAGIVDSGYVKSRQLPPVIHYHFGLADSQQDLPTLGGAGPRMTINGTKRLALPATMTLVEAGISFRLDSLGGGLAYGDVKFDILRNNTYDGTQFRVDVSSDSTGQYIVARKKYHQAYNFSSDLETIGVSIGHNVSNIFTSDHSITLRFIEGYYPSQQTRNNFGWDDSSQWPGQSQ